MPAHAGQAGKTRDPYRILVSEFMLQQTQVERVIHFYKKFLRTFPSVEALARAPFRTVLSHWQGLGYNRRAKCLHAAAKRIDAEFGGTVPHSVDALKSLSGVGPYTARAVAAFAFNAPEVFIETNIRTVFLHHCYASLLPACAGRQKARMRKVTDAELLPLVKKALKKSKMPPREFYAALMDYGARLKHSGLRLNAKSTHYVKQSRFEGSARQLRGAIVRELLKGPVTLSLLTKHLSPKSGGEVKLQAEQLVREGLLKQIGRRFALA